MTGAGRAAISYSPSRVMGALGRRRRDAGRTARYRRLLSRPLVDAVLFESFAGKMVGDSPLDLCRELQARGTTLTLWWTVADRSIATPEGTTPVVFGSVQWLEALATARYLVNNSNNPWYFRKREGQTCVQTWHGTPLKRLVRDIETGSVTQSYLTAFARDSATWDYLVSPNPFCSEALPRAFAYTGPVLDSGYPRNDRLVTATAADRSRIRASLGVSDDRLLLLYAPTWRDTVRTATGKWSAVNHLPSELDLPEPWTVAFRGHTNTHDTHTVADSHGYVDVTRYPDGAELLIAADALLTDYSSVMFDFTVTGRPVIFLTPDLEHYVAARGLYLDLAAEAPGPMLRSPDELAAVLTDLDQVSATYAERYSAWRQRFNCWDDGHAAERVVDAVFAD